MKFSRYQYRAIYASLIVIAFFMPAHSDISAFQFMIQAIGSTGNDTEITLIDLLVILLPLLLIPATALFILLKAVNRQPLGSLSLSLPFFSLAFFFLILSFDMNRQVSANNMLDLLLQMRFGFYLAAFASVLLIFSHSRREALNLGSGKR